MRYDDWKQQTPPDNLENKCGFCGEDCEKEFCDRSCKRAYELDN